MHTLMLYICINTAMATIYATPIPSHAYSSHVSVVTPLRSYSHGVGPALLHGRRGNLIFNTPTIGSNYHQGGLTDIWSWSTSKPEYSPVLGYPKESLGVLPISLEDSRVRGLSLWDGLFRGQGGSGRPQEALWPRGLFLAPTDLALMGFGGGDPNARHTPDFSDGLAHPDPLLLEGVDLQLTAQHLRSPRAEELFFHRVPHRRALLWLQAERRDNGLDGHRLGSIRHGLESEQHYRH